MSHNENAIANEVSRLSNLAMLHRMASTTGLPFEYAGHTYKGDSAWHLKCAKTLEKASENLARQLPQDWAESEYDASDLIWELGDEVAR